MVKQQLEASNDSTTQQEETTNQIDPLKDFTAYIESNKDAKEFYSISLLTGDLSTNTEPTELEKRQFLSDYEVWIKAGKPRPSMPSISKGVVKIPTAAYRIRDRGVDKMYVYYNDGTTYGKREEFFKKNIRDPITGDVIQTDEIDDTKKPVIIYDVEFTTNKSQGIINEANKLLPPGNNFGLYFWYKGNKNTISEENFVKSYETISDKLEKKQSIN